jgi:anti-sigma factor RsiW
MECSDARPLVPAYLDGEITEARAAPLRRHLLECQSCRGSLQEGRALQRWFGALREASADARSPFAAPVPAGFAARVARRAFAGDEGRREIEPALRPGAGGGRLLAFVLNATAIAAALLLVLAIAVARNARPSGGRLSADDRTIVPLDQLVEDLDRLDGAAPDRGRAAREPRAASRLRGDREQ